MPLLCQEGNALVDGAHVSEQDIDQAGLGLEQVQGHTGDDNPGQEVGQVQDGLGDLLVALEAQLVEQQGQDDGHREAHQQIQEVEGQGVLQRADEVLVAEDLLEGLEADPLAPSIALGGLVIHKGDSQARIGGVLEDDNKHNRHQQHQVELPVIVQIDAEEPQLLLAQILRGNLVLHMETLLFALMRLYRMHEYQSFVLYSAQNDRSSIIQL